MSAILPAAPGRRGFTLVEVLIVVVILGVLAMIVVPSFVSAQDPARMAILRDHLRIVRIQVEVFTAHHRGLPPGYPGGNSANTPTEAAFVEHMTYFTSEDGGTSATASGSTPLRPLLQAIPTNPFNDLATVRVLGNGESIPAADGSTGWFYKPLTRQFIANIPGNDPEGQAFVTY